MSSDMKLDEFTPTPMDSGSLEVSERSAADLAAVYDVPVNIQAVLGHANLEVASLLRLSRGSVIELDRKVLSELAVKHPAIFKVFAESIR